MTMIEQDVATTCTSAVASSAVFGGTALAYIRGVLMTFHSKDDYVEHFSQCKDYLFKHKKQIDLMVEKFKRKE
jgi:hypothetical protein